ncbi:hypothetical protein LLG46_11720 [bacterium]|nr:hypothetical protein [bacterium]
MRCISVIAILFLAISLPTCAQVSVPQGSIDKLSSTFSITRDKLWELNDEFWHEGEFERCIAMMRLITRIDPHDTQAYSDGAWLMQNQLRDDEAEVFLLEGLANNGDVYDLYFELGYYYYLHERFDEAIDYLIAASTFDAPMTTWHTLAHAYELAGYVDSSLGVWAYRNSVDPENPVPPMQIERILSGGPASGVPRFMSQARQERKARAGMK